MVDLIDKTPPQALEAEMAVLGAMLIEREAQAKVLDLLDESCFYKPAHQAIFRVIAHLFAEGAAVDVVTVGEQLKNQQLLAEIGGSSTLTDLANVLPTAANVDYYARIVKDKALLRRLIQTSTRIVASAYSQQDEVVQILDEAERQIFSIAQSHADKGFVAVSDLIHDVIETVEKLYQRKTHVTGVPTGFTELDAMTSGFQPSNLVIIAGRPSMGKTSFALNIAEHVAIHEKRPVALFSLEMSREELMLRLLCSQARVDSHKVRRGYLEKRYWNILTAAASQIAQSPIFIDDSSSLSVIEMRARARRLAAELAAKGTPLALICVDYLQLMRGIGRVENRQQEISEISRNLKALARDLRVPVIALSQLSRRPEEKGREGRPQLADLRESGAIEQDADLVAFIYREEIYKPNDLDLAGKARILIAKQRNGPTGEFELTFLREYTRFENRASAGVPEPVAGGAG
jgi:replicative DNA helicase